MDFVKKLGTGEVKINGDQVSVSVCNYYNYVYVNTLPHSPRWLPLAMTKSGQTSLSGVSKLLIPTTTFGTDLNESGRRQPGEGVRE